MTDKIDLSGLRDIHWPVEPSWWPPALGWWLVFGGMLLLSGLVWLIIDSWYRRPKQEALREIKKLFRTETNSIRAARKLSVLLKRIVLLLYPNEPVATLSDEAWITFLTEKTKSAFNEEQLNLLAGATYMPDKALTPIETDALSRSARQAVLTLFERKNHGHQSAKHS